MQQPVESRLDGDFEAWQRRILLLRYTKPKPKQRIDGFREKLMATEVEGILALLVRGAMNHRKELREIGDFRLTEAQQKRVTDLVLESDSLRQFVNAHSSGQPAESSLPRIWSGPILNITTTKAGLRCQWGGFTVNWPT